MLDGCALEALKILCPCISAAAEAGIDAVDDAARLELALEEGNALVDKLEILRVIGQPCLGFVPVSKVSIDF
jgi:hypothetical protein